MITLLRVSLFCIALLLGRGRAFSRTGSTRSPREPLQWLIVGGGPHGVHIATRLLEEVPGLSRSQLCIVDEEPTLLRKWKQRTAATGMEFLRSSPSYHLDVKDDSLLQFEKRRGVKSRAKSQRPPMLFAADYQRPKLDFFNQHCDHVIEKHHLDPHVQGRVSDVIPKEEYVEVEITQPNGDTITRSAEHVVLALGSDGPAYPDWVTENMRITGKVKHLFDEHAELCPPRRSIAIVGGGISAAHFALKHCKAHEMHMICRHDIREQQFDTHQDWMMDASAAQRSAAGGGQGLPKCKRQFARLESFAERRDVITRERIAGTIPAAVSRGQGGLRYAISSGHVRYHKDNIRSVKLLGCSLTETVHAGVKDEDSGQISLSMASGDEITVDQIVLATGFNKAAPASGLINKIAEKSGLTLGPCGYPAPDEALRWHARIYLAGALAELQLGPSARNLAGARLASERIVAAATAASSRR